MSQFPHLLSPLKIGNTEVRNRILVSAHVPGFAENNKPGEKYVAYHRNYAHHGVGLQITGGTPVHESGLLGTTSDALWNLDDDIIPGYQMLSDAVHAEGGCILAQLAHSAGTVLINQPGRASWSASAIRSETTGNISHAMSQAEIDEVIGAFAAAAELLIDNGVEVEIVTSDIAVGADIDPTNRTAWYMRLGDRGCVFSAAQLVESAEGNRVLCRNVYDHRGSHREGIDLIVNWHGCRTDESLAAASAVNGIEVHAIGDCVSPRNLEIAIAEAEALAHKL